MPRTFITARELWEGGGLLESVMNGAGHQLHFVLTDQAIQQSPEVESMARFILEAKEYLGEDPRLTVDNRLSPEALANLQFAGSRPVKGRQP